ncbi:MAG: acyltransferase [Paludibacteraceae bacterium]|nr:acyltransferase [Paludibacteraceae bacterium]
MKLQKGHIDGVDLARIIGAFGIVVFHFACYAMPLKPYLYETANCPYGQIWVALFFALSGACIARSNVDTGIWSFYKKRWMAVFPMFFIAYAVVFALKLVVWGYWWGAISWWTIPLTLVGMDSFFYYLCPNFCCIGEWFIGALIVCYLLFPLLRKALTYIPYTTAIILLVGCAIVPYLDWFTIEPWHNLWVCTTIFYLGMLLSQYPKIFTSKVSLIISALIAIIISVIPMPFKQFDVVAQIGYPIIAGISYFIVLTCLGAYLENSKRLKTFLSELSSISYPVFLVQHVVIFMVLNQWATPTISPAFGILFMDIVLTMLLAYILKMLHTQLHKKLRLEKQAQEAEYVPIP